MELNSKNEYSQVFIWEITKAVSEHVDRVILFSDAQAKIPIIIL